MMSRRWSSLGWAILLGVFAAVQVQTVAAEEAAMRASKPEVRKDVIAILEAQLAAFRKGDTKRAYEYAATELRAQKSREVFMQIVEASYPEIWSSQRAQFGIVRDDGQRATVTAQVYSKNGDAASYDYTLTKEKAGWRVLGVLRRHEGKGRKL